jgi:hypothetical protein
MAVKDDIIYYGDDGPNLKALTWKSGILPKKK